MAADSKPKPPRYSAQPIPQLISIQEASAQSGIPVESLRDLVHRGALSHVALPGSRRLWLYAADVRLLIEQSTTRGR